MNAVLQGSISAHQNALSSAKQSSHLEVLQSDMQELVGKLRAAENRLVAIVERAFGSPPKDATNGVNAPMPIGAVASLQSQVGIAHSLSTSIHTLLEKVESII